MQPVRAEVNNHKRTKSPRDFFFGDSTRKYQDQYDFMPSYDDPQSDLWDDPLKFISWRKERMIAFLQKKYQLVLV
jgi:hypothetical protein